VHPPVRVLQLDAFTAFSASLAGALAALADTAAGADAAVSAQHEWLRERVIAAQRSLEESLERCAQAHRDVEAAEADLTAAEAGLSACQACRGDDDAVDCSGEEHAVEAAQQRLQQTMEALAEAEEERQAATRRLEVTQACEARLAPELTRLREHILSAVSAVAAEWEAALQELARREARLQDYVRGDAPAAEASPAVASLPDGRGWSLEGWLAGGGGRRTSWRPDDLLHRFRLSASDLRTVTRHLAATNAAFRGEIDRRRTEWKRCNGAADRERVFVQVKRTTAGLWSELFVREAFAPLAARITTQRRTNTPEGDATVTDLVLDGVTAPVVLGRGEGRCVPAGGSLAVEVKARRAHGLAAEAEHLRSQVAGHGGESASLVIVTRDIHDLGRERAGELRAQVRAAGSAAWALLPRKEEIDQLCWDLVRTGEGSP
jgi:hypothetical protein